MASRFPSSDEQDILVLEGKSKNPNTSRSTRSWLNTFRAWAESRAIIPELSLFAPTDLNDILRRFYTEIRKENGREYEPDSLRVMLASLHRHLVDCKYPKSIIADAEFKSSRDVLEGKARMLREKGMGKKTNATVALTVNQEQLLWDKRKLGPVSPEVLLHTMWYNNTQYFGQRGRQEHISMDVENFKRRITDDGLPCIEFWEDPTKCRGKGLNPNNRVTPAKMVASNCERCPIALFELYMSKRPEIMKNSGRFYLTPKQNATLQDDVCYIASGVGKNKLCEFMKAIVKDTELEHSGLKFTNHSARKTAVKKLKKAQIPESSIIKLTGHSTEKGLKNYDPGDDGEFTAMSHAITGASSTSKGQCGPIVQQSVATVPKSLEPSACSSKEIERRSTEVSGAMSHGGGCTNDVHTIVQQNLSSVAVSLDSSGCRSKEVSGNIFYHNCKVYNIQTMHQTVGNKKRKYVIDDSSDDSQQ